MGGSIFVELRIADPQPCQVAALADETKEAAAYITRTASSTSDGSISEDISIESGELSKETELSVSFESDGFIRIEREQEQGCVCERIEKKGCPVRGARADDGNLHVSFCSPDIGTVKEIIADLRNAFGGVELRSLSQMGAEKPSDLIAVDKGVLTNRQRTVLETAYTRGYFDHPRRANAGEIATELGISSTTFIEHLSLAQSKLLSNLLE
ncbi:helix-turn-helix domain-containing protein [Haladaptatus sp. NG-SE-30]